MWYRLTRQATQVLFTSHQEALRLGSSRVGPEHLLMGLMGDWPNVAARVLQRLRVSRRRLRGEIERRVGRGSERNLSHQYPDPRLQQVMNVAYAEAEPLGREWQVGTEHLLLGLLREEGLTSQVLLHLRVDADAVRRLGNEIARTDPEDCQHRDQGRPPRTSDGQ
jgi:ATP-dependent Clp protease ATP-binding subunit ClpC